MLKIPEHLVTKLEENKNNDEENGNQAKNMEEFEERIEISFSKKFEIDNSKSGFSGELKNHKCR